MAVTDLISSLAEAMAETRTQLSSVEKQINDLNQERGRVAIAPPHADDIAAVLLRGLEAASTSFEQRLAWHLNDANARDPKAAENVRAGRSQLLMIPQQKPEPSSFSPVGLFPYSGLGERQSTLDVAAVTYFLRDRIAEEIPALVNKLCPSARNGMKQADRDKALAELDAEISDLIARRGELQGNLAAARKAANPSL